MKNRKFKPSQVITKPRHYCGTRFLPPGVYYIWVKMTLVNEKVTSHGKSGKPGGLGCWYQSRPQSGEAELSGGLGAHRPTPQPGPEGCPRSGLLRYSPAARLRRPWRQEKRTFSPCSGGCLSVGGQGTVSKDQDPVLSTR